MCAGRNARSYDSTRFDRDRDCVRVRDCDRDCVRDRDRDCVRVRDCDCVRDRDRVRDGVTCVGEPVRTGGQRTWPTWLRTGLARVSHCAVAAKGV